MKNRNVHSYRVFGFVACIALVTWSNLFVGVIAASEKNKTVSLTIDLGKQKKVYREIDWKEKMTVLDAMNTVKGDKKNLIQFQFNGKGRFALLTSIDGKKNEGGRGLNWIYQVNGKLGDRSFAVYELRAGDRVVWKFGKYP